MKLPAYDEMVHIPAGIFHMGSDKKVDKNSYGAEFPQRKVYLDALRSTSTKSPPCNF